MRARQAVRRRDARGRSSRLRPAGDTRSSASGRLRLGHRLGADVREQVLEGVEAEHSALEARRADLDAQQLQEVIGAAYQAFHDGLHAALYVSAGLALAAGLLALITLRQPSVNSRS